MCFSKIPQTSTPGLERLEQTLLDRFFYMTLFQPTAGRLLPRKATSFNSNCCRWDMRHLHTFVNLSPFTHNRKHQLEESLLFSGRFSDAIESLMQWLYKIEPQLSDETPVMGDIHTVNTLMDRHDVSAFFSISYHRLFLLLLCCFREELDVCSSDTCIIKTNLPIDCVCSVVNNRGNIIQHNFLFKFFQSFDVARSFRFEETLGANTPLSVCCCLVVVDFVDSPQRVQRSTS